MVKVSYNCDCDYELEECGLGGSEKATARLKSTKALKAVGIGREQADDLEPDILKYAMEKQGLPQSMIDTEMERKGQKVVSQSAKDNQAAEREMRSKSTVRSAAKSATNEEFVRIAKENGISQKTIDTVLADRAAKGFTPPVSVGLRSPSQQKAFVTKELLTIGLTRSQADAMTVPKLKQVAQEKGLKPEALELMLRDRQQATSEKRIQSQMAGVLNG